jgi:hypothetical protein
MSNSTSSGDAPPPAALASAEIEAAPATIDTRTRLVLPDPLPDDANPFRVINWILFTAYVAACHLTDARRARVRQLGRKMRTEDRNGVLMLHCEDDVDRRLIEDEMNQRLGAWYKAQKGARNLCAGHGIPFAVYDPLLKAAWAKLEETWSIIQRVASDKEVYLDNDLTHRLEELADSTTPANTPPLRQTSEKSNGTNHSAGGGDFIERQLAGPANARPKRGKNIDARMLKILAEDKDAFSWTARRWAERLGCSPSTVAETTTWKTHLHKIRAAAKVERAERSLRRRP